MKKLSIPALRCNGEQAVQGRTGERGGMRVARAMAMGPRAGASLADAELPLAPGWTFVGDSGSHGP